LDGAFFSRAEGARAAKSILLYPDRRSKTLLHPKPAIKKPEVWPPALILVQAFFLERLLHVRARQHAFAQLQRFGIGT